MNQNFDVNKYWLKRGRNYIHEPLPAEYHRFQERFLLDVLRASHISFARILELGCGFGRITRLIAETFQDAKIAALDLSPEQLENARRYCAHNPNISFHQYDFYSGAPLPGSSYDVVLAVEVFLHHPLSALHKLLDRLSPVARHVINLDWSEPWILENRGARLGPRLSRGLCRPGLPVRNLRAPQKSGRTSTKALYCGKRSKPKLARSRSSLQTKNPDA